MIRHDITVEAEDRIHGMVLGNVIVAPSGLLYLHGMVNGNINTEPGGEANIHGTVNGDLVNQGDLYIAGSINGRIHNNGGRLTIEPDAMINGQRYGGR